MIDDSTLIQVDTVYDGRRVSKLCPKPRLFKSKLLFAEMNLENGEHQEGKIRSERQLSPRKTVGLAVRLYPPLITFEHHLPFSLLYSFSLLLFTIGSLSLGSHRSACFGLDPLWGERTEVYNYGRQGCFHRIDKKKSHSLC